MVIKPSFVVNDFIAPVENVPTLAATRGFFLYSALFLRRKAL